MSSAAWRSANRDKIKEIQARWRAANPEYQKVWYAANKEHRDAVSAAWRAAYPERNRAIGAAWVVANPERAAARQAKYRRAHPERNPSRVRRLQLAGVKSVTRFGSDLCGVCHGPLTQEVWPHPLSTTIGHEPPLSRLAELGLTETTERPEHWGCNSKKGSQMDSEMRAA